MTQNDVAAWKAWQASQKGSSSSSSTSTTNSAYNSTIPGLGKNGLPNYIPTNNNAQVAELKQLLGNLPGYFDTTGLEKAFDQQQQFNTSAGMQASNNAAREFVNRQSLQGGDRSLGGLVRAQSMLPFLQQNAQLTGQKEQAKLGASEALAKIQGDVASNLGQLRTNYLATLANYTSNMQQLSSSSTLEQQRMGQQQGQFNANLGLEQQRLALARQQQMTQSDQQQQQINLQRMLALSRLGKENATVHSTTFNWGNSLGAFSGLRGVV